MKEVKENSAPKTQKKGKKIVITLVSVFLALVLIASASAYCLYTYYIDETGGANRSGAATVFNVPEGASFSTVAKKLESEGFIGSELCFKIYIKLNTPTSALKAGKFELSPSMSYGEIITVITGKPIQDVYRITVIEGLTQKEILESLSKQTGYTAAELLTALDSIKDNYDFLKNLPEREYYYEGYLYPDTYELFVSESAAGIMKKFLDNFHSKLTSAGIYELAEKSELSLDEIITLASVVQCETTNLSELKDVAGVFVNRLKIGMKLESCVTVYYVRGDKTRPLTIKDTEIDSPYNTYVYAGLPKGPISNMRIEAIVATLEPSKHDYYYFIGANGKTYFAKTYKEHNDNIDKYL